MRNGVTPLSQNKDRYWKYGAGQVLKIDIEVLSGFSKKHEQSMKHKKQKNTSNLKDIVLKMRTFK